MRPIWYFVAINRAPLLSAREQNSSATSGRVFSGDVTRSFPSQRLRFNAIAQAHRSEQGLNEESVAQRRFMEANPSGCKSLQWAVVTTIFEPTDAIRKVGQLDGWCLVIIADEKTRDAPYLSNFVESRRVIYLSVAQQRAMANSPTLHPAVREFVVAMPWNHFARKNIGYLFAIGQGARLVFDFDDDNELKASTPMPCADQGKCASLLVNLPSAYALSQNEVCDMRAKVFNPYPTMGASVIPAWPRGFPLERIKSRCTGSDARAPAHSTQQISLMRVGTIQLLADNDPDVDAIFRLTQRLPFTFRSSMAQRSSLVLPSGTYAPTNAQATIHTYDALWSTLLPVTVHGRVADIWRGYVAQRVFHDLGLSVVFAAPRINQTRNAHNYLADMSAEQDLYLKSGALLRTLASERWKDSSNTLPSRLEQLAVALYEREFIAYEDVRCMQKWIAALLEIGYKFPTITRPK